MGRPRSGFRWLKEGDRIRNGKTVKGTWRIRDTDDEGRTITKSTGIRVDDPEAELKKERALEAYLSEKRTGKRTSVLRQTTDQAAIADVITLYIEKRLVWDPDGDYEAPLARPHEVAARLEVLLEFFGDKTVDWITPQSVSDFSRFIHDRRVSAEREKLQGLVERQAAKRETVITKAKLEALKKRLSDFEKHAVKGENDKSRNRASRRYLDELRAALNCAHRHGLITNVVKVPMPGKYKPRAKFFERVDVAALLRTALHRRGLVWEDGKPNRQGYTSRHVARFIIMATYTGSRKGKLWRASFRDEPDRPWIELKQVKTSSGKKKWIGRFHKLGDDEIEYEKKRAPGLEIPDRLVVHLVRWKKMGLRYPCEYEGNAADPKGALQACIQETFGRDSKFVAHTFRHTAATWLMRDTEIPVSDIASYLGISVETLLRVYGKHRRKEHAAIGKAFSSGKAGREVRPD